MREARAAPATQVASVKCVGELARLGCGVRPRVGGQQRMHLEAEAGGVEIVDRLLLFRLF